MSPAMVPQKRKYTAREAAEMIGRTPRTVKRLVAQPRDEYRQEQAERRERIRAYHDDEGHSWTQTAKKFKLHVDTVKQHAYRARKERQAEADALIKQERINAGEVPPPLPLFDAEA